MNSRLFLAVVTYFCFPHSKPTAGDALTKVPGDAQVAMGSTVRLECFVERVNYPPAWSQYKIGEKEFRDVYVTHMEGNKIVGKMTEPYYQRFRVHEDRETGEYSLMISDVQAEDAGKYACIARGGLGQKEFAELIVIEFPIRTQTNISDRILGENDCHRDPDLIGMSCSFRSHGNVLPKVLWTDADHLGKAIREDTGHRTQEKGVVTSDFVINAASEGINGTSYVCIVPLSSEAPPGTSNSFNFPRIHVLTMKNITESRTVVEPEEINCIPPPGFSSKGCKWFRKEVGDIVSEDRILNLHNRSFISATFVCIMECDVRGLPCPVEVLVISYRPTDVRMLAKKEDHSKTDTSISPFYVIAAVGAVVLVVAGVGLFLLLMKKKLLRSGATHLDTPDGNRFIPGDQELRLRRKEEEATARMHANTARLRMQKRNEEFVSGDGGDVAEGLEHHSDAGEAERSKAE